MRRGRGEEEKEERVGIDDRLEEEKDWRMGRKKMGDKYPDGI
jgi:hypothetical protein